MARKIKAKVSYKKNKKVPKAFIGGATMALGAGKAILIRIDLRWVLVKPLNRWLMNL